MIGDTFLNINEEKKVDKGNERQKWKDLSRGEIFSTCQLRVEGRQRNERDGESLYVEEKKID